ncbi:MAG: hypothetical protein Q4G64_05290 [bacterium]|nr:hypothetical protein [bacterium]
MAGTYIHYITPSDFLREPTFATQAGTDAKAIDKHSVTVMEAYKDTEQLWKAVDPHVKFPGDSALIKGVTTHVEPEATAISSNVKDVAAAITTFSDAVTSFKTTTYDPLIADVEEFNALHMYEYTYQERQNHNRVDFNIDGGGVLFPQNPKPPLPTETRTAAKRSALITRLTRAQREWKTMVEACVSDIGKAKKTGSGKHWASPLQTGAKHTKASWDFVKHWIDVGGKFGKADGGKLIFTFSSELPSFAQSVKGALPKFLKPKSLTNWIDKKWGSGLTPWNQKGWSDVGGTFDPTTNKWNFSHNYALPFNVGPKGEKVLNWFDDAGKKVKKITDSKAFKFADKALTVIDVGVTYYDSYQTNYNEALKAQPHLSPDELRREAVTGAAIEGTFEAGGKLVGGAVGRAAGAALGQAILPIPGVGAAVGGFLGGLAGEKLGGALGKSVGGFVNDWRREGFSKAVDNVGEAAWEGVKDAGKSIVDGVGKAVTGFGKVTKLFGWG